MPAPTGDGVRVWEKHGWRCRGTPCGCPVGGHPVRGTHTSGAGKNPCGGGTPGQARMICPYRGRGAGVGKTWGGGVGAPLVGALWEGIRCEGHTRQGMGRIHAGGAHVRSWEESMRGGPRQGLGKIHAGRPHQGRHKACPYRGRGAGVGKTWVAV